MLAGQGCEKRRTAAKAPPPVTPTDAAVKLPRARSRVIDVEKLGDLTGEPPAAPEFRSTHGECSTGFAPRPKRDRFPMCKVTGGSFMMGAPAGEPGVGPRHRVRVSSFLMDQLEVTNAQYLGFLNLVGTHRFCPGAETDACIDVTDDLPELPIRRVAGGRYVVAPELLYHPVVAVSLAGARAYCRWAGKDVPTSAQWEYAAAHDPATGHDRRYPWGDVFEAKRANCGAPCADGFERTSPVGTFDGTGGYGDGASAFGVRDLAGNVGEYVLDYYSEPYEVCDPECVDPVTKRNPKYGDQWFFRSQELYASSIPNWQVSATPGMLGLKANGFRCVAIVRE